MSSSTEPKPILNDEETSETAYRVEEDDDDNGEVEGHSTPDHFSHVRPSLLKTPSVLNAIIDQIHPEIVARFDHRWFSTLVTNNASSLTCVRLLF